MAVECCASDDVVNTEQFESGTGELLVVAVIVVNSL